MSDSAIGRIGLIIVFALASVLCLGGLYYAAYFKRWQVGFAMLIIAGIIGALVRMASLW